MKRRASGRDASLREVIRKVVNISSRTARLAELSAVRDGRKHDTGNHIQIPKIDCFGSNTFRHQAMPFARPSYAAFSRNCKPSSNCRDNVLRMQRVCGRPKMPPASNWRSSASYMYVIELDPAELAWEFLRRNPDYQRDYRAIVDTTERGVDPAEALARRWGLPFRHRSRSSSA